MPESVRIFVSHHHSPDEDRFTSRLVDDLEEAGADVWVDNQDITSDDFVRRISEGLAGRQWLVLVMTPAALLSPWVQREVNTALSEHTAGRMLGVLPLVMTPCDEREIPLLWRTLYRYDATQAYEPVRDRLFRAMGLTAQLGSPAPEQWVFDIAAIQMYADMRGYRRGNTDAHQGDVYGHLDKPEGLANVRERARWEANVYISQQGGIPSEDTAEVERIFCDAFINAYYRCVGAALPRG